MHCRLKDLDFDSDKDKVDTYMYDSVEKCTCVKINHEIPRACIKENFLSVVDFILLIYRNGKI